MKKLWGEEVAKNKEADIVIEDPRFYKNLFDGVKKIL